MLKVGIWGCGGISAMHRRAYETLKEQGVPVELVALCDINPENFNKEIKINKEEQKTSKVLSKFLK